MKRDECNRVCFTQTTGEKRGLYRLYRTLFSFLVLHLNVIQFLGPVFQRLRLRSLLFLMTTPNVQSRTVLEDSKVTTISSSDERSSRKEVFSNTDKSLHSSDRVTITT